MRVSAECSGVHSNLSRCGQYNKQYTHYITLHYITLHPGAGNCFKAGPMCQHIGTTAAAVVSYVPVTAVHGSRLLYPMYQCTAVHGVDYPCLLVQIVPVQ